MVATADRKIDAEMLSNDERWQAVVERDSAYDGLFVYGVLTTGIYCRPSCASRKPKRENAAFFAVPEVAEQSGFRPCLRCNPALGPEQDPQIEIARQVCRLIADFSDGVPTLSQLANETGVSPHHLQKTFKKVTGVSPRQYADAVRLGTLKEVLRDGADVTEALYEAGYGSSSRLYENTSSRLGMTPVSYKHGGVGLKIRYTVADCSLGKLLVAATERGICAVSLGDSTDALEAALRSEFGAAEIENDDVSLKVWLDAVLLLVSGRTPRAELPLDVQATAFQRLVWEELRKIPFGETRSYGEIAKAIGKPSAARAVGRACGNNPAAVIIPCHRAVRNNGGMGGYKWGLERKQALLTQEQTPVS